MQPSRRARDAGVPKLPPAATTTMPATRTTDRTEPRDAPDSARRSAPPSPVEADRGVTLRDFVIFSVKLFLDGAKDLVLMPVAMVAVALDMLAGGGRRPRVFYAVLRLAERFDLWLNLTGALDRLERDGGEDGLFGGGRDRDADTLLAQIERLVRREIPREEVVRDR